MVQFFNLPQQPADRLAEQAGQNFGQGVNELAQQQYRRGMLQESLQKAKGIINDPNVSISDKMLSLMETSAGIPGSEKYIGPLAELLYKQSSMSKTPEALRTPTSAKRQQPQTNLGTGQDQNAPMQQNQMQQQGQAEMQPGMQPQITPPKTEGEILSLAKNYEMQTRPDLFKPQSQYGQIPTFNYESQSDMRPEEEADFRDQMNSKNIPIEVQEAAIQRAREDIRTRYAENLKQFGMTQERQKEITDKWGRFRQDAMSIGGGAGRLTPTLEGLQTPEGQPMQGAQNEVASKYFQYAQEAPVNMTPEMMHSSAMAKLDSDMNKIKALQATPSLPPVRTSSDMGEYIGSVKPGIKDLVKSGFPNTARELATYNLDMGNEEFHAAAYGDDTSKEKLNQLHAIKAPKEYSEYPRLVSEHPTYNKNYPKERENYINKIAKTLEKIGPNDDLILLRSMVLDNQGSEKDFIDGLNIAEQNGLKLSPLQLSQVNELEIPRRRPLWELFSDKGQQGIGPIKPLNWSPFINYLRGKK